jgi:RimJ/RimL family protein N-acetyltransferase
MTDTTFPPVPDLDGDAIRLRALGEQDADALFALHSDPRVMRYWSFPPWTGRAQAVEHIARLARERQEMEFYPWVATLPGSQEAIGTCSLFGVHREHGRGVIGYALRPEFWGRGHASAMLALALGFAFGPLDLNRIEADIDPDNVASCRLVERAGFRREGYLRERWRVGGGVQDTALYGLLRREWRGADARAANGSAATA